MRGSWLLFILVLFAAPAAAVDGFDQPGGDYTNFEAASWFVCRNSCGGDSRCRAWTWVKPDIQGPAGRCWLKDRTPPLVRNACCNSGSGANIRKADLKAEDKTDRPGFDINNFTVRGWQECERACAGESQCGGWSYARAGVPGAARAVLDQVASAEPGRQPGHRLGGEMEAALGADRLRRGAIAAPPISPRTSRPPVVACPHRFLSLHRLSEARYLDARGSQDIEPAATPDRGAYSRQDRALRGRATGAREQRQAAEGRSGLPTAHWRLAGSVRRGWRDGDRARRSPARVRV